MAIKMSTTVRDACLVDIESTVSEVFTFDQHGNLIPVPRRLGPPGPQSDAGTVIGVYRLYPGWVDGYIADHDPGDEDRA